MKVHFTKFILFLVFLMSPAAPAYAANSCQNLIIFSHIPVIETQVQVLKYVSANLNEAKTDQVISKFIKVFEQSVLAEENRPMSEEQFYSVYFELKKIAESYEIKIVPKSETMGVFPEGLDRIGIAGFSEPLATSSKTNVSFAMRHELAHLFHVIALRAILFENSYELKAVNRKQLTEFVEAIEGGRNYLEFEKIVTDISGFLHIFSPVKSSNIRFFEKLKILLTGLKPALLSGRVKFKNGWGLIEVYAKFISRAPLVLGKSFTELAFRMPFIYFATQFATNASFRSWLEVVLQNFVR